MNEKDKKPIILLIFALLGWVCVSQFIFINKLREGNFDRKLLYLLMSILFPFISIVIYRWLEFGLSLIFLSYSIDSFYIGMPFKLNIRFSDLVIILTAFILFFKYVINREKVLIKSEILPYLLTFIFGLLPSSLLSEIPKESLIKQYSQILFLFFIYVFFINAIKKYNQINLIYYLVIFQAIIPSIYGIFKIINMGHYDRAYSYFINGNGYALYLLFPIFITFSFFNSTKIIYLKWILIILFSIFNINLFFAFSRAGYAGITLGFIVYGIFSKKKFGFIIGITFLIFLFFNYIFKDTKYAYNVNRLMNIEESSAQNRFILHREGLICFLQRPIFGHGLDSFRHVLSKRMGLYGFSKKGSAPHSLFLQILVEAGIIGFLSVIMFLFSYALKLIKYWKIVENDFYKEILAANLSYWTAFMVFSLSHDAINYRFFYIIVFVGTSIMELIKQGKIK